MTISEQDFHDSVQRLLRYAWADEYDDYVEQRDDDSIYPNDDNHIFTHLVRIDQYLSDGNGTAEDLYGTSETNDPYDIADTAIGRRLLNGENE